MTNKLTIYPTPFNLHSWYGGYISHGQVEAGPITEDDIEEVIAEWETPRREWDGDSAAVLKLKDGRYVAWVSWWGPTGDGFGEDAYGGDTDIHFAATLDEVIRWGLDKESRIALGLPLDEDK